MVISDRYETHGDTGMRGAEAVDLYKLGKGAHPYRVFGSLWTLVVSIKDHYQLCLMALVAGKASLLK